MNRRKSRINANIRLGYDHMGVTQISSGTRGKLF